MESKKNKTNELPEKKTQEVELKLDKTFDKLNETSSNLGSTINKSNEFIGNINELGKTFLESKKIQSETKLGLKKIEENHKTINNHINTEYKKQKQAMDKAENVIDSGLESGNIDMIKIGLDTISGIANHNPMTDLKNHLDNQIEKDFEDDDFTIEI